MTKPDEISYPVLIQAPDISAYQKGNTGIDYIHHFDSGTPGPHVMISAVSMEMNFAARLPSIISLKMR